MLEKIKALIEEIPGFETIRYHYYRLITELFAQNFGRKIYDWCKKNQIQLTGHYLAEDTLEGQISVIGDAMVLYESMQWPGVDHLGRNLDHPLTLKQCSSVAHQLGKERVLSELYGCSGQSFTLAERKWIGDWHIVLGINFFCPHLYLYSLRGTRKRDYPPTISHHQPYWKYNKPLEDYFARLNFILSKGTFKANILVVHPIESSWCVRGTDEIKELDDSLAKITQSLLENKFEYDFGNESLMEKYASVEDGKLIMGKMSYEFVIITPSVTIRRRTISLLKEFYASGGKIFASEKFPSLVEGKSERGVLPELRKRCVMYKSTEHLITLLKKSVPCEIEIRDEKGENIPEIFIHRRELDPSTSVVFFANTSIKRYVSAQLKIKSVGKVWEADPFTGKLETVSVNKMGGAMIINCDFHGVSSHLLVIENRRKPVTGKEEKVNLKNSKKLTNWNLWLDKPNVLILDFCRYKSGKMKSWSKFLPVIKVQDILEKENRRGKISLLFEFKVEKDFVPENLNLVIEQAERYHILLNGKKISSVSSNWWLDKSFKIVTLPSDAIKKGKNQLVLTALFIPPKKRGTLIFTKDGIELETIYLLGNFSLKTRKTEARNGGCYYFHTGFSLSNPQQLTDKDLNVQGYPFYTGSLLAETEIEIKDKDHSRRYFIRFDEFRAVAAGVTINSKYSGVVYLPPYHIEVTKLLKKGRNTILLEIVSSLRNLLGPHHQKDPNPEFVDPNSFLDMENWSQAYSTHAFGLGRISLLTYSK
ncbi:MAG TPA: hypothetical protein EYP78_02605 [Candidatus Omnitrophica bacterium]|nr:hypothetical protein [Candidatus Omnitrophota bacterium]